MDDRFAVPEQVAAGVDAIEVARHQLQPVSQLRRKLSRERRTALDRPDKASHVVSTR